MPRFARLMVFVPAVFVTAAVASIAQQPAKFEDVVRNLRNPDPKIRISAVRLLRETGYAEAITPLAAVISDQVNEIQLEAIDAELSFFWLNRFRPRRAWRSSSKCEPMAVRRRRSSSARSRSGRSPCRSSSWTPSFRLSTTK